jgi:hypothetical protein
MQRTLAVAYTAQVVCRLIRTAEDRVLSQGCPCRICGARSGTATGLSPSPSGSTCQYPSTPAPYPLVPSGGWTMEPLATAAPEKRNLTVSQ